MELRDIISEYIKKNNLSARQFADRCSGISHSYLSFILNNLNPGTGKPPVVKEKKLQAIADGMGIPYRKLLDLMNDRKPPFLGYYAEPTPITAPLSVTNRLLGIANDMPDYDSAATEATQLLMDYGIFTAPIDPLHILKSLPSVLVVTFTELANEAGMDDIDSVMEFGAHIQDAVTFTTRASEKIRYIVAYNQRQPISIIQLALARELGGIVLGHDSSRDAKVRYAEALAFARHLLCPRPLIKLLQEKGIQLTVEALGNMTGLYGRPLAGIKKTMGAYVPPDLNRRLKEGFSDYAERFTSYNMFIAGHDASGVFDFGSYMDLYTDTAQTGSNNKEGITE